MPTAERKLRPTLEQQIAEQELILKEGETPLRYRDVLEIQTALVDLAGRHRWLPTKEARLHVARCLRAIKPYVEEREAERRAIQEAHTPESLEGQMSEGDKFSFVDPLGMTREFNELDDMVVAVVLPSPLKDKHMPTNDKAHPNNEDGLSAVLAMLGPLYAIDLEEKVD